MPIKLFDYRIHSGARNFVDFRENVFFDKLREHAEKFEGASITGFVTDWVTEVWLDFDYRGHHFAINNQMGDYWFFVDDPKCPDEILLEVAEHFRTLLEE